MKFSAQEKLKAVERELGYRRYVFPKRVAAGRMSQHQADEQIAIFIEIAADYKREAERERLL